MKPLKLSCINFMNHSESIIDFTKLPSFSIVVGIENNNKDKSNGTGKTNLFNAIKYCIFDSKISKTKDKVIKDGTDKCEVEFEFEFMDNVYKIQRYKTRTTQGVKLYLKNESKWDNLSGRTLSQTNEKIITLLGGINEQSFENSFYLKQNDYKRRKIDALASATAEERKSIIIDMLNLTVWNVYEKKAKKYRDDLFTKLTACTDKINELGSPNTEIAVLQNNIINLDKQITDESIIINKAKEELDILKSKLESEKLSLSQEYPDLQNRYVRERSYIVKLNSEIESMQSQIENKKNANISSAKNLDAYTVKLNDSIQLLEELVIPEKPIENVYKELLNSISKIEAEIRNASSQMRIISKPIPKDEICKECGTELDDIHRQELQTKKDVEASKYENIIKDLTEKLSNLNMDKLIQDKLINDYNIKITDQKLFTTSKNQHEVGITACKQTIERNNEFINSVKNDLDEKIDTYNSAIKSLKDLKSQIDKIDNKTVEENIKSITTQIGIHNSNINTKTNNINLMIKNKGNIETMIDIKQKNYEQLLIELDNKKTLSYKHNIAKIGTSCFGSVGIPSMIIQSVLDSLQDEANELLEQMKPGAKLQFVISKERNDGVKIDTLDIIYTINGLEQDFLDLSGGQQCLFVTALKLASVQISRKRCGSEIKLLLLDETDQALDGEGSMGLYNIANKLSKDITVLLITHNEKLKEKFDKVIWVDNDGISSKASVVQM